MTDVPHNSNKPAPGKKPFFPPEWAVFARRVRNLTNWWEVGRRLGLYITIFLAALTLYWGVTEPVIKLTKLFLFEDEHSLWSVVRGLFQKGEHFLGAIIFTFSIAFPGLKLFYLMVVAIFPTTSERNHIMSWMSWLGKWSMLDVLVLALVIFYAKSNELADAATLHGVYYFTASVVLTMVAYGWVKRSPK